MNILDIIIIILLISWIGGFTFKIAGGAIHLILVVVLIIIVFRLLGVG